MQHMGMVHKQLVTDEEERPIRVLIPYEEWMRIEQQLGSALGPMRPSNSSVMKASFICRKTPIAYQRRLRDEWA